MHDRRAYRGAGRRLNGQRWLGVSRRVSRHGPWTHDRNTKVVKLPCSQAILVEVADRSTRRHRNRQSRRCNNQRSFTVSEQSIYAAQCQQLRQLFEQAPHAGKVLCVALDYAKTTHLALFCNGRGDILHKPFPVHNDPAGLQYLLDRLARTCRHHGIARQHAFFGGESVGPYADNFVQALRQKGHLVAGVNAWEAKQQRDNHQASTDRLDLLGIAKLLLLRRGNFTPAQSGAYWNLRELVRQRRRDVRQRTAVSNRIHTYVDRLCPGFLEETRSRIAPFSEACLWLLADRFSAQQLRRRRRASLIVGLQRCGTPEAAAVADQLQQLAAAVLVAPSTQVPILQVSLQSLVAQYRCLQQGIAQTECEIAHWLAQTPAALLTTVSGIGILLAAGITGELGDPYRQGPLKRLCSYAGIVPRVTQTGGPAAPAVVGSVARRCNRILKDYLVQSADHLGRQGPQEFRDDWARREAAVQHAAFGLGRRYLRLALCLMRTGQVYLPPSLRHAAADPAARAGYYRDQWPTWREKWKKANALAVAVDPAHPLGQWREMVQSLYQIRLPL
jgi:transposase